MFRSDLNLTEVIAQRIQEHIMAIQSRIVACANSVFCINIENNLIFGAPQVKRDFLAHRMPIANVIEFISEETNKPSNATIEGQGVVRAGSNTNSKTKPLMVARLHRIVRNKALKVHRQCVQVCKQDMPDHLEGRKSIDILANQLNNMVVEVRRVDPNHPNSLLKQPSTVYRPEGGNANDDSFMSLCIAIDAERRSLEEINISKGRR